MAILLPKHLGMFNSISMNPFFKLFHVRVLAHGTSIRQSSIVVLEFKAPLTPSIKFETLTIEPPNIGSQEDSNEHPLLRKPLSCAP
jgi:hypothetical protein